MLVFSDSRTVLLNILFGLRERWPLNRDCDKISITLNPFVRMWLMTRTARCQCGGCPCACIPTRVSNADDLSSSRSDPHFRNKIIKRTWPCNVAKRFVIKVAEKWVYSRDFERFVLISGLLRPFCVRSAHSGPMIASLRPYYKFYLGKLSPLKTDHG